MGEVKKRGEEERCGRGPEQGRTDGGADRAEERGEEEKKKREESGTGHRCPTLSLYRAD